MKYIFLPIFLTTSLTWSLFAREAEPVLAAQYRFNRLTPLFLSNTEFDKAVRIIREVGTESLLERKIEALIEGIRSNEVVLTLQFLDEKCKEFEEIAKETNPSFLVNITPLILQAMKDENEKVRLFAAWSLVSLVSNVELRLELVEEIVTELFEIRNDWLNPKEDFYDPETRTIYPSLKIPIENHLVRLGQKNPDAVVPLLLRMFENKPSSHEVLIIIDTLRKIKDNRIVPVFVKILDEILEGKSKWQWYGEEYIGEMRGRIIKVLGDYPEQGAITVPVLIKVLLKLSSPHLGAIKVLGKIADKSSLPYLLNAINEWLEGVEEVFDDDTSDFHQQRLKEWRDWKEENLKSFDKDYVDFMEEVLTLLEELKSLKGKDESTPNSILENLVEIGNENGSYMKWVVKFMLVIDKYSRILDEITYILGQINAEEVIDEMINVLKIEDDNAIREMVAIALSQKDDNKSIEALREVLGERRGEIFDKFGIWIIDLRVDKSTKFIERDLREIEEALDRILKEHLKDTDNIKTTARSVVRFYPGELREIYPIEWELQLEIKQQFPPPAGSYENRNKLIRINETWGLKRTIYHEVGHAVHYYLINNDQWEEFVKLHEQSVAKLPPVDQRWRDSIDYSDFAYPYGATNVKEDFATIYELWFKNRTLVEERAQRSDLLRIKLNIVQAIIGE